MELNTSTRPITLRDTDWDLLARHCSPAGGPPRAEGLDYSGALSRLLRGLSDAPAVSPQRPLASPLGVGLGDRLVAHTDGACSGNPGPGGWAAIIVVSRPDGTEQEVEVSGGAAHTTNNQMELTAAISALEAVPRGAVVEIVTDSQYVAKGATEWMPGWVRRSWKKPDGSPPENLALWKQLRALMADREVTFRWAKGHAGVALNERADALAREMAATYGAEE